MKNIHILPTDKPSRLHLGKSGLILSDLLFNSTTINPQHIYITSEEEIKEGDWYLDTFNTQRIKANQFSDHKHYGNACKKIILTTDQDLIKDGVQAIDDRFLEWFVRNPSCEEVEVYELEGKLFAEPIIPKEEPKQETLEEAAERYANNWEEIYPELNSEDIAPIEVSKIDFIAGTKWQQGQDKNKYSEGEVLKLLIYCKDKFGGSGLEDYVYDSEVKEWFEQFKKFKI